MALWRFSAMEAEEPEEREAEENEEEKKEAEKEEEFRDGALLRWPSLKLSSGRRERKSSRVEGGE